ncbi:hypothetical protein LOK49_LG14G00600 [Camellia lanceoleosa]|uniref:Uncharacterized protein n=1 Tax=Camellia lanceoleosa TaxID=1840588 RepID=A0ACC0FCX0_9ERIC|nr:hypothetical protein LOK49_LG14G00600 [Camellia lanceoleosa]
MATATTDFHRFPPINVSFFHLSFSVAMATASTDFHRSTSRSSISLSVAIATVATDFHRSTLTLSLRQLSGLFAYLVIKDLWVFGLLNDLSAFGFVNFRISVVLQLSITLEMSETISRHLIHPSRRHSPTVTKSGRVEEIKTQYHNSTKPISDLHSFDPELIQRLVYDSLVWSSLHGLVVEDKNVQVKIWTNAWCWNGCVAMEGAEMTREGTEKTGEGVGRWIVEVTATGDDRNGGDDSVRGYVRMAERLKKGQWLMSSLPPSPVVGVVEVKSTSRRSWFSSTPERPKSEIFKTLALLLRHLRRRLPDLLRQVPYLHFQQFLQLQPITVPFVKLAVDAEISHFHCG